MMPLSRWQRSKIKNLEIQFGSPLTSHIVRGKGLRFVCPFAVIFLVSLSGCAGRAAPPLTVAPTDTTRGADSSAAAIDLQQDLNHLFRDKSTPPAIWGVHIRSLDRNQTLYSLNSRTLLIPGSTLKIVTLAAAVEQLGWDFTFDTRLIATGPIKDGVLNGDLIVQGSGDPTIDNEKNLFTDWAKKLKMAGITRITGRLIGDDRAMDAGATWPGTRLGPGWSWDDLIFGFAAPTSALTYRENTVHLVITPSPAAGQTPSAHIEESASGLTLVNRTVTSPRHSESSLRLLRLPGQATLELQGAIPVDTEPIRLPVSVDDPTLFFLRGFHHTLLREGIEVMGETVDINDIDSNTILQSEENSHLLLDHQSSPLSEFAIGMMKRSQNLYAETIFRTLGDKHGRTIGAGQIVVKDLLESWSIETDQFIILDGSGLSRYNYITPEALVRVLEHVRLNSQSATIFEATLPIAGQDGTLAHRMKGTNATGNARAKTGTMSNVSGLSGFVQTRDGETLVFAILANNYKSRSSAITRIIDRAVEQLADFAR